MVESLQTKIKKSTTKAQSVIWRMMVVTRLITKILKLKCQI